MSLPTQNIFDPDQFTQQQTENLINEDYQDAFSSVLRLGIENQQGLQQLFYPPRIPNSHFISSAQLFQQQQLQQQQQQQSVLSPISVLTNGEFLKQQMSNPLVVKSIKEKYSSYTPSLKLILVSHDQSEVELDEDDISGVFERFGNFEVKMEFNGRAIIEFRDIVSAYFAWSALNGMEISSQRVTINLEWLDECQKQQSNYPLNTLTNVTNPVLTSGNYTPNNTGIQYKNIQNENIQSVVSPPIQNHQSGMILKQMNINYQNPNQHNSNTRMNDARSSNQNLNPVSKGQNQTNQLTSMKNQNSQNQCNTNIGGGCGNNMNMTVQSQNMQLQQQQANQNMGNTNNISRENQNVNINIQNTQIHIQNNNCTNNNNSTNQNSSQNNNTNNNNNNNSNINNQNNNIKYTCRYEIQISNDKDFQVARKIIGSRGENMKTIIKKCLDHNKKKGGYHYQNDDEHGVKLRLRGKGSGYKEGPEKQESQESLHLCVSSMYYNMYKSACYFVEELLQSIYDDYYKMCHQNSLKRDRVYIKKQESTNGKGNTTPSSTPQQQPSSSNQQSNIQQQQPQSQPLQYQPINQNNSQLINGGNNQKPSHQHQQVQYLPVNKTQSNTQNTQNIAPVKETWNGQDSNNTSNITSQVKLEKQSLSQNGTTTDLNSNSQSIPYEQSEQCSSIEDLEKNSYENSFVQQSNENDSDSSQGNQGQSHAFCIINPNSKMNEKQIVGLIEQRNKARKESNFLEADRIRNFLKNNGIALMDEKGGRGKGQDVTTWKYSKNGNPISSTQQQNSPNGLKANIKQQNNNQVQQQQQNQSPNTTLNTTTNIINNINNL